MNPTDISVDAGLNVVNVQGLDKAREEIAAAVAAGIQGGVKRFNAANNATEALAKFDELQAKISGSNRAEALAAALVARQHLSRAARVPGLSNEARMGVSNTTEQINALTNMYRTLLKATGELPTATQVLRGDTGTIVKAGADEQRDSRAAERAINRELEEGQKTLDALALKRRASALQAAGTREYNKFLAGDDVYTSGSKEDQQYRRAALRYQLQEARRAQVAAGQWNKYAQAEYESRIKKLTTNSDKILENVKKIGGFVAAGATGIALGNKLSNIAAGYYAADKPFTYMRQEIAKGAQYAGGAIGAILGGALGSFLGPLGTAAGAAAGGGIGAWLGGIFNRDQAAATKAKTDATQMARYSGLYPATQGGGWQFAKMAEEATGGLVSAASVEQMAATSQEFAAAMAFGGVSESQMLGMTMLPNYYASVMGGESPEQQMAALSSDLDGMDPGIAQYAARLAGVPADMVALARNPAMATRLLGEGAEAAAWVTRQVSPHSAALLSAQFRQGREDRIRTVDQTRRAASAISSYDYDHGLAPENEYYNSYRQRMADLGFDPASTLFRGKSTASLDGIKELIETKDNKVKRELNIYINNEQVATVAPVYTDADIGDYVSFAAGNL